MNNHNQDLFKNPQTCATIFSMVQTAVLLIDAETHIIVDANPWALKMFGADRDTVIGSSCHKFICPSETGSCPVTDFCKQIDNSQRIMLDKNGREIPILKTVSALELEGKKYLIESFLDISEQEHARQELTASESRYRDLFENANDLIQMVDPNGSIEFVNRSWKETLGYNDVEINSLTMQDIIHPEHLNSCMLAFQKLLTGEQIDFIETTFITKDGTPIELEGSINCNMLNGKPVSSRGIFRNVTERKKAEKKQRESEMRYQDLFNNISDLIQMVKPDGSFQYVNPALLNTLGYEQDELLSLHLVDIIPTDLREKFQKEFTRALSGQKTGLIDTEFKTKTGRRIPVEGTLSTQIQAGGVVGIRFIWRNITERKRAARKIQEWNRKLESIVEEKTQQLRKTQARLLRTGKMAAIGGLVAGTSHELNNPLGGILSAVDILLYEKKHLPLTQEIEDELVWLNAIKSAAERCNTIVDDLRKFSEHSNCQFDTVDINQLLLETIESFAEDLQNAEIVCNDQRDMTIWPIDGDQEQLRKVLENILKNAQDAIVEKGQIEFETRRIPGSEETAMAIEIIITDDGCGIPEENLEKVFDPFFTTQPASKRTGLGLAVSYGIVKRHGGDIEIESTAGRGTQVRVSLPVKQQKFSFPAAHN